MKGFKHMSDRELADYMAGYKESTPEWIMCQQEFKRREGMPAARRAWIAIWISIAALALSAMSALLSYFK